MRRKEHQLKSHVPEGLRTPLIQTSGLDPGSAAELRIPSPLLPSTTSPESDDDDFQIEVRMTA